MPGKGAIVKKQIIFSNKQLTSIYINNFLKFKRTVVTSGHCICGLYTVASSEQHPGMACKEATASVLTPDQITHYNRISVDGGSKNIQNPNL